MDEIGNMLQKIRTLAVQASTGTNTPDDKAALSKEANSLIQEVNRIAKQTTYGGKSILDGGDNANSIYGAGAGTKCEAQMVLQVGANSGDQINFDVANFKFAQIATAAKEAGGLNGTGDSMKVVFSQVGEASKVIKTMDAMIKQVDSQRVGLGVIQNRLESSIRNQANVATNESDARARIRDTDFAEESANLTQQSIIQQAATSMLMQANTRPQLALSLLG